MMNTHNGEGSGNNNCGKCKWLYVVLGVGKVNLEMLILLI